MQKPNLISIPNFILVLMTVVVCYRSWMIKGQLLGNPSSYSDLYYNLFCSKERVKEVFLCSDLANLSSGVVFGLGNFSAEFKSSFKSLGLTHLIVASGTQVGYLFDAIDWILIKFGVVKKLRFGFFALSCFGLFALIGFTAPLVRASIFLGLVMYFSTFFGRYVNSLRLLIYTGIIMLIIQPSWITSLSYWLSMLACLGLSLASTFKVKYVPKLLMENIWITILLVPIYAILNGQFNVLAIVFNLLLINTIPYLIFILLICLVPYIGFWVSEVVYVVMAEVINLLFWIEDITPFLNIKLPRIDYLYYYSILGCILALL